MRIALRTRAFASFALMAFGEGRARATVSAITINAPLVSRAGSDGVTLYECPGRGSSVVGCIVESTFQGVGHRDCIDDTQLVFPIQITGLPDTSVNLQVWAGTSDCTQAGATNNASTATCWPVASPPSGLQAVMNVNVRVADLVGPLGVVPPPQVYQAAVASKACNNSSASTTTTTDDAGNTSTTVGESTVNVFFMFYPNGQSTPSITAPAYPVKVKLVGPAACSSVVAGAGDSELIVTWVPPGGDTSIQGYNIYGIPVGATGSEGGTQQICSDATTGTEIFDDAGNPILDDAGNPVFVDDAGNPVTQDAGCYTQIVPPTTATCNGSTAIDVSGITCGNNVGSGDGGASTGICTQENGTTNAQGTLTGVTNGTSYEVAVAAFDQFGNTGQISSTVCSTPEPINDFWKIYNQDGGHAFCALEAVGQRGGSIAAAMIGIVGIVFMRRRRRSVRTPR